MDALLGSAPTPFTYVQLNAYHHALLKNILATLGETFKSGRGDPILLPRVEANLLKVLATQLAIYQKKNEILTDKWVEEVSVVTRETEAIYQTEFAQQCSLIHTTEQTPSFEALEARARQKAIDSFREKLRLPDNARPLKSMSFLLDEQEEELRGVFNSSQQSRSSTAIQAIPSNQEVDDGQAYRLAISEKEDPPPNSLIPSPVPQTPPQKPTLPSVSPPSTNQHVNRPTSQEQDTLQEKNAQPNTPPTCDPLQQPSPSITPNNAGDSRETPGEHSQGVALAVGRVESTKERAPPPPDQTNDPARKASPSPPIPKSKLLLLISVSHIYARLSPSPTNQEATHTRVIPPFIHYKSDRTHCGAGAEMVKDYPATFNVCNLLYGMPSQTFNIGFDRNVTSEQIIAKFLRYVKRKFIENTDITIDEYLLCYPACATNFQRRSLIIAAKLAQFEPIRTISMHLALAAALAPPIQEFQAEARPLLLVHFTVSTFHVAVAVAQAHSVTIVGQAGSTEDRSQPQHLNLHTTLVDELLRDNYRVSQHQLDAVLAYYKGFIVSALGNVKIGLAPFDKVHVTFQDGTRHMRKILNILFQNTTIIELEECQFLHLHESALFPHSNQPPLLTDVHPRTFGILKQKVSGDSGKSKGIKIKLKSLMHRKEAPEQLEKLAWVVQNQPILAHALKLKFSVCSQSGRRYDFVVGSQLEEEVYKFETLPTHCPPFTLKVALYPYGLYTVRMTDSSGCAVALKNTSFPHLDDLLERINRTQSQSKYITTG